MVKRILRRIINTAFITGMRHPQFASLYYTFFSSKFSREHHAVLHGQSVFKSHKEIVADSSTVLRRNIHRIEKGLIMKPRRNVFALDYIEETVETYAMASKNAQRSNATSELNWAHDVLEAYFDACAQHPVLDRCRMIFNNAQACPRLEKPDRASKFKPYTRRHSDTPPVAFNNLHLLAKQRRSVRWFEPKPVPRELVEKAVSIASLSPSACNRQPFEFRFFDEPDLLSKVANLPSGTVGFADDFPLIGVVLGNLGHYYDEKDRHVIYIDGGMAAMSLVLALETLGLSSCCINWPDIEEYEIKAQQTLGLHPCERPVMFLAIGYPDPDGLIPYSEKKTVSQLCKWNQIG
jgi:nitroreductase